MEIILPLNLEVAFRLQQCLGGILGYVTLYIPDGLISP